AAGTYTVVATNATTSCTADMTGTAVISIDALPTASTVTGGGSYCSGGTGLAIGLDGSESGVNYQLQLGGSDVGSVVSGTGSAISFGLQTAAGTYTVVATNATTSCTADMTGTVAITINSSPTMSLTAGPTCNGPLTEYSITIENTQGVNLLNASATNGTASVSGTSVTVSGISSGSGTVVSVTDANGCTADFNQVAYTCSSCPTIVTFSPGPAEFCAGGSVILTATPTLGTAPYTYSWSGVGSGTSNATTVTSGGVATVQVTDQNGSGCAVMVNVNVTENANPTAYTVTGGGSYCSGGTGVVVGLDGSESGINYQLQLGGSDVGSVVSGTGSAISFGLQTAAGTYTVVATNATTTCTVGMTGSVDITINLSPTMSLTAGPTCNGPLTEYSIAIDNTQGVNLINASATNGTASVSGTSVTVSGISSGSGTVVSVTDANGCTADFDQVVYTCSSCPIIVGFSPGPAEFCAGGSVILTATPTLGTGAYTYLWSGVGSGTSNTTTVTSGGVATLQVTDQNGSGCTVIVNVNVTENANPTAYSVSGGGSYCSGGTGVVVGLDGSEIGVNYQLQLSGSDVGSAVSGTGSAISFGLQMAAGTYTVVATNATTACTASMIGNVDITIDPLPTASADSNSPLFEGSTLNLTESGVSATAWSWTGPNTFTSTDQNPSISSVTTAATGRYYVTITDVNSCQNVDSVDVLVVPPIDTIPVIVPVDSTIIVCPDILTIPNPGTLSICDAGGTDATEIENGVCVDITGATVGTDTICVVVCDTNYPALCDTTIITITITPPIDTIPVIVPVDSTIIVCPDILTIPNLGTLSICDAGGT
ncbi:MAG: hypothetical protein GY746_13015, partial [Gammaproteobacteria bacterium]|nr:hypothetical protein [Gammaproteobacteria bacterium]